MILGKSKALGVVSVATMQDIIRYSGGVRINRDWIALSSKKGRLVQGIAGAVEQGDDEWFIFLDLPKHLRRAFIFRYAKTFIQMVLEKKPKAILAIRDDDIATSEAFLTRLGFRPTDRKIEDKEVWQWVK